MRATVAILHWWPHTVEIVVSTAEAYAACAFASFFNTKSYSTS